MKISREIGSVHSALANLPKRRFCAAARRGRTAAPPEVGGGGGTRVEFNAQQDARMYFISILNLCYQKHRMRSVDLLGHRQTES